MPSYRRVGANLQTGPHRRESNVSSGLWMVYGAARLRYRILIRKLTSQPPQQM